MRRNRTATAGAISGLLGALAYLAYIRDLLTNPSADKSLTGWIIWVVVGFLIFKSYVMVGESKSVSPEEGETNDSRWLPLIYAVGPPVIVVLLIFKCHITTANFTWLDWTFLTVSLLSGVYLWVTKESLLTLHVNMLIDGTGSAFVALNAWRHPGAENVLAWLLFTLAGIANLFAVKKWEYRYYVYPVAVTIICTAILALTIFR